MLDICNLSYLPRTKYDPCIQDRTCDLANVDLALPLPGKLMVDLLGVQTAEYWDWIDPGAMALLGAVSFMGGVTRLTMSLTVIMLEMTNDIQFLLLIMTTVLMAKCVGDFITHPLYHALCELKCIPFLEQDPVIATPDGDRLNLETFQVRNCKSVDLTARVLYSALCFKCYYRDQAKLIF